MFKHMILLSALLFIGSTYSSSTQETVIQFLEKTKQIDQQVNTILQTKLNQISDLTELKVKLKNVEAELTSINKSLQGKSQDKLSDEIKEFAQLYINLLIKVEMAQDLLSKLSREKDGWVAKLETYSFALAKKMTKTSNSYEYESLETDPEVEKDPNTLEDTTKEKVVLGIAETMKVYVDNLDCKVIQGRLLLTGVTFVEDIGVPTSTFAKLTGKVKNLFSKAKTDVYYSLLYNNKNYFRFKDPLRLFASESIVKGRIAPKVENGNITMTVNDSFKVTITKDKFAEIKGLLHEHITFWQPHTNKIIKLDADSISKENMSIRAKALVGISQSEIKVDDYELVAQCIETSPEARNGITTGILMSVGMIGLGVSFAIIAVFPPVAVAGIITAALITTAGYSVGVSPVDYMGSMVLTPPERGRWKGGQLMSRYILLTLKKKSQK